MHSLLYARRFRRWRVRLLPQTSCAMAAVLRRRQGAFSRLLRFLDAHIATLASPRVPFIHFFDSTRPESIRTVPLAIPARS